MEHDPNHSFQALSQLSGREINLAVAGMPPIQGRLERVERQSATFSDGTVVSLGDAAFSARPVARSSSGDGLVEYIDHNGDSTYWPKSGGECAPDPGHPYDWG